jgi:MOSC domain-containing protein YiiM
VGLPREVLFREEIVTTGIFKEPVEGQVKLRKLNLDGDKQADLTVHGGEDKAVYAYPMEHYEYWHRELPNTALPWGMFGENFTTEGLIEDAVNIGDRFHIGSSEVVATQPRMPCWPPKLNRSISYSSNNQGRRCLHFTARSNTTFKRVFMRYQ